MAYSTIFGGLTAATGAELDTNFNQAGLLGTIPCTVAGTNALTLTPNTAGPPLSLQTQLRFSGIAANTNTGAVTAVVAGLASLSVYKDTSSGPQALSGSEIVQGNYIVLSYDAALNSGAGGYHLQSAPLGGLPSGAAGGDLSGTYPNPTVAKINGVPLGTITASAGRILVANGTNWPSVAMSGDATLASGGAITVTKTSGTAFTAYATAAIGQLPGTATNDTANAGNIGEFVTSFISSGSAVSLTTTTPANVTSISLTAGDWDVWATVQFKGNTSTTVTGVFGGITSTSATLPGSGTNGLTMIPQNGSTIFSNAACAEISLQVGLVHYNLLSTIPIYMVAQAVFAVSTVAVYGQISARRVR